MTTFNTSLPNVFQSTLSFKLYDDRYRSSSLTLFRKCFYVFDILQSRTSARFRTGRDYPDTLAGYKGRTSQTPFAKTGYILSITLFQDLACLAVGVCVATLPGPALTGDGYASRRGAGHICCKVADRTNADSRPRYPLQSFFEIIAERVCIKDSITSAVSQVARCDRIRSCSGVCLRFNKVNSVLIDPNRRIL